VAPVLPGLHSKHPLDDRLVGRLLLGELNCTACHEEASARAARRTMGPDLSDVGWRVASDYMQRFIADPAATQAGTKMPGLLGTRPPAERAEIATSITHFLVAGSPRAFSRARVSESEIEAGEALFHSVGCIACHDPRIPAPQGIDVIWGWAGAVDLGHVPDKYSPESLAEFLFEPTRVRPAGRMPDMGLTQAESRSIAAYLIGTSAPTHVPLEVLPELVTEGARRFELLGCAACHALDGMTPPRPRPAGSLDPTRGCLAPDSVDTPRYALSIYQKVALRSALASPPDALSDKDKIDVTLTALNCIGCHVRDDYGGVSPSLDPYFTTSELDLGNEARIPPQLTLVGAKLQGEWLRKVLFDAASVRSYMHTRMPRFGAENLAHLPELFAREDDVEPFEMPIPKGDAAGIARDAGRVLLGIKGLSCISCHDFNGKPSPNFRGLDLIDSCERLQPGWFARFLIEPQTYRPGIVMPESWPGGVAAHPILEGDTQAQIRAIWYFLSQGRTARTPEGVSPVRSELRVTDTTRTYRGRSSIAGFRGIAVGYPGGLNYAFNARTGTLTGIWSGDFISVRWDGQGAGDFNPSGRAITLAQDVSFYRLPDAEAPWPQGPHMDEEHPVDPDPLYPRNRGYRFRGYFFDEESVPTFMYESGDVSIEDRSEAEFSGDTAVLVRTLRFSAASEATLYFRALTGEIEALSQREFQAAKLRLRIPEGSSVLRRPARDGAPAELLLELALPAGTRTLSLEYEIHR